MKRYIMFTGCVLSLVLLSVPAGAVASKGHLAGWVQNRKGEPVDHTKIRLMGEHYFPMVKITNKDGAFSFRNLPVGHYTLVVEVKGVPIEYDSKLLVKPNETTQAIVKLKRLR